MRFNIRPQRGLLDAVDDLKWKESVGRRRKRLRAQCDNCAKASGLLKRNEFTSLGGAEKRVFSSGGSRAACPTLRRTSDVVSHPPPKLIAATLQIYPHHHDDEWTPGCPTNPSRIPSSCHATNRRLTCGLSAASQLESAALGISLHNQLKPMFGDDERGRIRAATGRTFRHFAYLSCRVCCEAVSTY